jgi:predicted TIM-barrel fold metal-dependent hydrolase
LERLQLKLVNVCVAHAPGGEWRRQASAYRHLAEAHPRRYAWCTTFDPPDFGADYAERTITSLEKDFAAGAIACKMWKNIGMEIRQPSGEFVLVDDPLFEPIYEYLARAGKTVLMHIGEPRACWEPLEESNPHRAYYSQHPEWHMYNKPEYPSHQQLTDARDRVLAQHPKLRVVGAHMGSLEHDVVEVAKRLERYPNFAVDTSARTRDLALQDREVVRQFFDRYRHRVLFGTDVVIRNSQASIPASERLANLSRLEQVYRREFAYYGTKDEIQIGAHTVRGLALGATALESFYHHNAIQWYV